MINISQVAKEAFEKIGARIAFELNRWDRENNVVHGMKDKIVKVFKRDFELMEGQIAKLEGIFLRFEKTNLEKAIRVDL